VASAALGCRLDFVERLAGGTKKGVYRLHVEGGATAVAYVWGAWENAWPDRDAPDDVFADASGLDLYTAAQRELAELDVRTPRLLWADASHELLPADLAVVEDAHGGTLDSRLADGSATAATAMLREWLERMAQVRDPRLGKVARPDRSGRTCQDVALQAARRDLAEAADRVPTIAAVISHVEDRLTALAAAVEPRAGNALVHGELGPDHVLLDDADEPLLIDIEGLTFFDAEWEHAFLEMRFGVDYDHLRIPALDQGRLRLYRLARHLSLVAGPLRLLDGTFPNRQFMIDIAAWHTERVLSDLEAAG